MHGSAGHNKQAAGLSTLVVVEMSTWRVNVVEGVNNFSGKILVLHWKVLKCSDQIPSSIRILISLIFQDR